MTTPEQFNEMLQMLRDQCELTKKLVEENSNLRQANQASTSGQVSQRSDAKKVDRPIVEGDMTDSDWAIFLDAWKRYKKLSKMVDAEEVCDQLRACCSAEVNRLLFTVIGQDELDKATEDELKGYIKRVAVKTLQKEVHRLNFTYIRQDDKEPITQFYGRLKAQAALCEFFVTCPPKECGHVDCVHQNTCGRVSYASDMISHQLIAGLHNKEFQSRILTESATLSTLEAKVARLQILESTEESSQLMQPEVASKAAATRKSTYKNGQSIKTDHQDAHNDKCKSCGRMSHGEGKSMGRHDCPARNLKCNSCGNEGHFKIMCRNRKKYNQAIDAANDSAEGNENDHAMAATTTFL